MRSDQDFRNDGLNGIQRLREEIGFTLIEVIITISILSIGLLGIAAMQASALRVDSSANQITDATVLGEDRLEQFLTVPFAQVVSGTTTQGNYDISWTVSDVSGVTDVKLVTVTVRKQGKTLSQLTFVKSPLL